jgi:crotonobetainyl-CoA:carnitine CoA-transferase CaiB-like acyl-CoA transferase
MTRPFEGLRVIDATHVLAGPFAAYQLAVLGADVIKVENPDDLDQVREQGPDQELNRAAMGTYYLTQGSNKRSMTLNLKHEQGREIFRQLVTGADVLIENYRAGSLEALGLGYNDLSALNEPLIYCSMTAFGQQGPRAGQTAYDMQIQATSGLMAATGTPEVNPIKVGPPVIDYGTGTMAAFAIASALYQREQTGRGQHIDLAMLDVALILMSADITNYKWNGTVPKPMGNDFPLAGTRCYPTKEGLLMLGAMNDRQHARLFTLMDRPADAAAADSEARFANAEAQTAFLAEKLLHKTATQWEEVLQANHIPATRVRALPEALADPQLATRGVTHQFSDFPGGRPTTADTGAGELPLTVPLAAFKYAHGGPRVDTPPPTAGQHNDDLLQELGYDPEEIDRLRQAGTI